MWSKSGSNQMSSYEFGFKIDLVPLALLQPMLVHNRLSLLDYLSPNYPGLTNMA